MIPWVLGDSNFVKQPSQRLDPQKTVFVGALHGMMNAEGLSHIMHDLFGNVLYAGIDTDKHKYPIGQSLYWEYLVGGGSVITRKHLKGHWLCICAYLCAYLFR